VVPPKKAMVQLKKICEKFGIIMVDDEVQAGFGRTGKWFGFEHFGIVPDVMTVAKALGGGYPIGAIVSSVEISKTFTPGTHGTTFGGNPLGCAVATAVIKAINQERLVERASHKGEEWMANLRSIAKEHEQIREVRGKGLMIGIEMEGDSAKEMQKFAFQRKQLVNVAAGKTIRLVPPLIISDRSMSSFNESLCSFLTAH
jgi:acetylornithine/succinyldiaminopimelate/putrescine aminotransferase